MTRISMCYEYTCHILFKEKMIKITFVVPIPPPSRLQLKKKKILIICSLIFFYFCLQLHVIQLSVKSNEIKPTYMNKCTQEI